MRTCLYGTIYELVSKVFNMRYQSHQDFHEVVSTIHRGSNMVERYIEMDHQQNAMYAFECCHQVLLSVTTTVRPKPWCNRRCLHEHFPDLVAVQGQHPVVLPGVHPT